MFIDTCLGSQLDLYIGQLRGHTFGLWHQGLVRLIIGGPPCRTVSRLRNKGPPGPRRVRGRGPERYGLENLGPEEMELVDGDSALFLEQVAL